MFLFQVNPSQELKDKINSYLEGCKKLLETAKSLGINMDAAEKDMGIKNENSDLAKAKKVFDTYYYCVAQLCSTDPSSVNMSMQKVFVDSYNELYDLYLKLFEKADPAGAKELNGIWRDFSGTYDESGKQIKPGSRDKFFTEQWDPYVTKFNTDHKKSGISLGTVSDGKISSETKVTVLTQTTSEPSKTNWLEESSGWDNAPFYGPAKDMTRGIMLPFYPSLNPDPTERWTKAVGYFITGGAFLFADVLAFWKGGTGTTGLIRQESSTGVKFTIRNGWKWVDKLIVKYFGEESAELVVKKEVKETTENLIKTETKETTKNLVKMRLRKTQKKW